MWNTIRSNWQLVIIAAVVGIVALVEMAKVIRPSEKESPLTTTTDSSWVTPSLFTDNELQGAERELVIYGEDIIANTARYFGPHGSVAAITNGMNCQNCHLNAGKKTWGNNYSAVYSTYPKFRDRSGGMESIYKRVGDCFERSLNGTAPDSNSREYQAIYAYIKWLGKDVKKGERPVGSGISKLNYLDRAADPVKGKAVYTAQCQSCHGANGEGQLSLNGVSYEYPPLWGEHSYNDGAGLFRLSNFAGYVKSNMPFKQATHDNPKLTTEEAWDVAAYVNSQPRPKKDLRNDWPDISKKPFDHPFGPYADGFSESQHKYGPYKPIIAKKEELAKKK
ncbi:MAG TPA: c-type cytochrome [Chitinophagaceae bacterium]|nr:c-type cytochrome [Chitinophagaceae bacterium]HRF17909.1 c-type cytochrome [Chitinophagaceae bacterium]